MKKHLLIILFICAFSTYGQEDKYEYSDIFSYESFEIKSDSFVYTYSAGLMNGRITGTIQNQNDTLILNSDIQPSYLLEESFNSSLNNDTISIVIKSFESPYNYGLRIRKGKDYYDLNLQDSSIVRVEYDSIENAISYYFNTNLLSRKEKMCIVLYKTNLRIEINWSNNEINKYELKVNELPNLIYYHFFTNKKAIIIKDSFVFLDMKNKLERTNYIIYSKKGIKYSKKTKVKVYNKS